MVRIRKDPPRQFTESISTSHIELRGIQTRAMQFPEGSRDVRRAVVCVAGMGANGRSFVRQRPLADDSFVLMLNTPTETPPEEDPLAFVAEEVEAYLQHEGLEAPVLLGSSFGGTVATVVALRGRVRLSGLVLVSPVMARSQIPLAYPRFLDLLEAPQPVAALVAPLAAQIMGGGALDREARDEIVREARHYTGTELKRRLRLLMNLDLRPRLPSLELPVLWVHGSRDLLVPWRRARSAARLLPAGRFELVHGAGHLPYLSHPEVFNAHVRDFLETLRGTAPTRIDAPAGAPA